MAPADFRQAIVGSSAIEVGSWVRGGVAFQVRVRLSPAASAPVFLGEDSSVTNSTGYRLDAGETLVLTIPPAERGQEPAPESIYAVASSAVTVFFAADPS